MSKHSDIIVVGAGIIGLAHAYQAARKGLKVTVLERRSQSLGASIRNFGFVFPEGQSDNLQLALNSRRHWQRVLLDMRVWHNTSGSLLLTTMPEEMAVIEAFHAQSHPEELRTKILTPNELDQNISGLRSENLKGGLWCNTGVIIDSREVISKLPQWLHETADVDVVFDTAVTNIDGTKVCTAHGDIYTSDHILVCTGHDFDLLYPELYRSQGFTQSKLQMLRARPVQTGIKLPYGVATGSSLLQYSSFNELPEADTLRDLYATQYPECLQWRINGLATQNHDGELILGDSHEYGFDHDPFRRENIDNIILNYLNQYLHLDKAQITERWTGLYACQPEKSVVIERPETNVTVINGVAGAGMTLSFGIAQQVINQL